MSTASRRKVPPPKPLASVERPDVSNLVIDDGAPVDNVYSERQMRLLVDPLYASWQPPGGRSFGALANVGVFMSVKEPPVVPDVLVSLDMELGIEDLRNKEELTYLVWVVGKLPEMVVEIVSNREGGELGAKMARYLKMRIPYYVVWDPGRFLGKKQLHSFVLNRTRYKETELWYPELELGVKTWSGSYQGATGTWLRWCDVRGKVLPTEGERAKMAARRAAAARRRAEAESQRAEAESQRAEAESQRAEKAAHRAEVEARRADNALHRAEAESRRADAASQRADAEARRASIESQRAKALAARLRSLGVDPEAT